MFAGFLIAMLLGRDPPLFIYSIIIAVGILSGITSGIIVSKVPGPEREEGVKSRSIIEIFREALLEPSLRRFIFILLMVALVSGVSRTFIVVYGREVFQLSDGMVALFAVFGGLGYLIGGLLIKFLIDRVGAKPLFSVCVLLGFLCMIPVIFFPTVIHDNLTTLILYLTFMFFMLNFAWLGAEGVMQTYFIGLVPAEKTVDMGIPYFFTFGLAGASGTFLSGILLDASTAIFGSSAISFRILFGLLIAIAGTALLLIRKLVPLGALPFKGALEVMFSFKELKAISLLEKLDKTHDSGKEEAILGELHSAPSQLAVTGLLNRAKSPRLSIRMESIRAMDALKTLPAGVEKALMDDIIHNPYTTAYRSARILGNHKVFPAVALLRELATADDYMLAGEAIVALAKLEDNAFRPKIEHIIMETQNPRLKIMGVQAFGIYGFPDSLPLLFDILKGADPLPYLRDEVVLAVASILNIQQKFYPLLVRFLADESMANTLAQDEVESAYEYYASVHGRKGKQKDAELAQLSQHAKSIQHIASDFTRHSKGSELSRWILDLPDDLVHEVVKAATSEAVLNDDLASQKRLQLLIVCWIAQKLRLWTDKLKKEK
jgi:predicted MFS family arabinose efflux permease